MTPIPPRAILFLIQSGWSVELILPLTVDSINGHRSRVRAGMNQRTGDPKFYRVVALLRQLQKAGAVSMRLVERKEKNQTTVLFFYRDQLGRERAGVGSDH